MESTRQSKVREWILDNASSHPSDIAARAVERFAISRQAVNRTLRTLVQEGLLTAAGRTKARTYQLRPFDSEVQEFNVAGLQEDRVWRDVIGPKLADVPDNVRLICQYGLTEMVNNVVDHSGSPIVRVGLTRFAPLIMLTVLDSGVGIFEKIKTAYGLDDDRHAILELSKGKLTTDPSKHSGQGVFFTSRAFDRFQIQSGRLALMSEAEKEDWLLEREHGKPWAIEEQGGRVIGTFVMMLIHPRSSRTLESVFSRFATPEADIGFQKTIVPISLAKHAGEHLVSRSQAKRILTRVHQFEEVVLDFREVETIGQAFADEMFRVYPEAHPNIHLYPIGATEQVQRMIDIAGRLTHLERFVFAPEKLGRWSGTDFWTVAGAQFRPSGEQRLIRIVVGAPPYHWTSYQGDERSSAKAKIVDRGRATLEGILTRWRDEIGDETGDVTLAFDVSGQRILPPPDEWGADKAARL